MLPLKNELLNLSGVSARPYLPGLEPAIKLSARCGKLPLSPVMKETCQPFHQSVILTHHILEVGVEVFDGTIYLHAQSIFDGHLE